MLFEHLIYSTHFLSKETFMTQRDTHEHENNKVFSYQRTCAKKELVLLVKLFFLRKGLFEDALIANPAYPFLWPISSQRMGIGIFNYSPDFHGIANEEVLIIGIIAVVFCAILRIAYEGTDWIKRLISL
uniref:Uncharacterized protein n=1 Tax=Candidatus Methanophagaceae archaeon ANME-1 ERB6 TaxID=2759912 RepID=A0A7G9YVY7_9EURY|nr:hypothetical protein MDNCFBIC_00042 [Methanosarcinales archaeon ANME-1 ERB6]